MKNLTLLLIILCSYSAISQKKHWINSRENSVDSKSKATAYLTKAKIKNTESYLVKYYKLNDSIYKEQVFKTGGLNIKHDKYIDYNSKGDTTIIGNYKDNRKNGGWIYINHPSLYSSKINFADGNKEGKTVELQANGDTILVGNYLNGLEHGKWSYYSEEKKIFRTLNYHNGIMDGQQILFYKDNQPREITKFSQGRFFSTKLFNQKGEEVEELNDNYEYFLFDQEPTFTSPYGSLPAFTNVKALYPPSRKPHASLEKEAIRVISSMPKFNPAVIYGRQVKFNLKVPINFQ